MDEGDLKELATEIFISLAARVDESYWDWQHLATRAGDAAIEFARVMGARDFARVFLPSDSDPNISVPRSSEGGNG